MMGAAAAGVSFSLFFLLSMTTLSSSSTETFVYGGCANVKFAPESTYETTVNSLLTSVVNSAASASYNKFTAGGAAAGDTVSALFQCRGDLATADCARCVARAVSQLGVLCADSCGGALQLEGCFVKYDNATFLGVEDKAVVVKKCGPVSGYAADESARRDAVLGYLGAGDGSYRPFRLGGYGDVQGVAQCTGDLSPSECQDCLSEAIQRLKSTCGSASSGDMYLGKCYVRYWEGGSLSHGEKDSDNNDEEIEKTLAILIGLIAGVALIIVFLSFLREVCDKGKDGK